MLPVAPAVGPTFSFELDAEDGKVEKHEKRKGVISIPAHLWQAARHTRDVVPVKLPPRIRLIWSARSEMYHFWKMERRTSESCV